MLRWSVSYMNKFNLNARRRLMNTCTSWLRKCCDPVEIEHWRNSCKTRNHRATKNINLSLTRITQTTAEATGGTCPLPFTSARRCDGRSYNGTSRLRSGVVVVVVVWRRWLESGSAKVSPPRPADKARHGTLLVTSRLNIWLILHLPVREIKQW